MKFESIRRSLFALILTSIAAFFIFIVLPPSRDAMNGIVTVYNFSQTTGRVTQVKYKVVIDAQAVIELHKTTGGDKNNYLTFGFDKCSVFNRTNWRCERSEHEFLMQDGNLRILKQNGELLLPKEKSVSRLRWWSNRLRLLLQFQQK